MPEPTVTRHVRIINQQKLDDRFLTAQSIESEDDDKKVMGQLFAVVEITRPWFPISQIGSRIITTLRKNYYNNDSTSDLVNFEQSVKKVNEMLLSITEQGETDWIGHLNAVMGVLVNREIHLTSVGKAQAFLFREGKMSHITENTEDTEPHPIKTFGSIISGTLLPEDSLMLSSPNLLEVTDLPTVKSYFEEQTPFQIGSLIVKLLKKAKTRSVGLIIIKLLPSGLDSNEPDIIYLDHTLQDQKLELKKVWQTHLLPRLKIFGKSASSLASKTHTSAKNKLIPATKKTTSKLIGVTQKTFESTWSKAKPMINDKSKQITSAIDTTITGIKQRNESNPLPTDSNESIIGRSIFTINDYQAEQQAGEKNFLNTILFRLKRFIPFTKRTYLNLKKYLSQSKNRPLVFSLAIVILIVSLIVSIAMQRRGQALQKVSNGQKSALQQAQKKVADGKSALVFGQKQEAQVLFGDAINLAEPLLNTALSDQAKTIVESSQTEYDKLTGATRFNQLTSIASTTGRLFTIISGKGYSISSDGKITEIGLAGASQPTQVANLPSQDKSPLAIHLVSNDKLLIANENQHVFEFDPATKDVTQLNITDSENIAKTKSIGLFSSNIYFLNSNEIWRYTRDNNDLKNPQKYLKKNLDISKGVDISIDGSVYLLSSDGIITKLVKGEKQDFKISNIPKPFDKITKPVALYSDQDTPSIFVLDNGQHRIIELDKNGQFNHQYILPTGFTDLKSFVVQPKGRQAFVVNGNKIYSVNL